MAKRLEDLTDRELDIRIVFSGLEGIENSAERMTSGNFMHNRANIKLTVHNIVNALHRLGIHDV